MALIKRYTFWQLCLIAGVAFIPIAPQFFTGFSVLGALSYVILERKRPAYKWIHLGFIMMSAAYFILNVISAFSADNQDAAWLEVQTKLSFLVIPVIMLSYWREFWQLRKVLLMSFIAGNLIAGVYCWFNSSYHYLSGDSSVDQFYGPMFSVLIHLGYYAILLNAAIAMMYYLMWKNMIKRSYLNYAIVGVLHVFLLQLVSKNGIVTLFFLDSLFAFILFVKYKSWKPVVYGGGLVLLLGFGAWNSSSYVRTRITEVFVNKDKGDYKSSTSIRQVAWDASIAVGQENIWTGVGTGDVKDELAVYYEAHDEKMALDKRLDSHNQFLYTLVEHGIIGVLLICLMFVYSFYHAFKNRHWAFLIFNISLIIPAMTESVFQTQAGVISYCFLWSMMFALMHGAGSKSKVD